MTTAARSSYPAVYTSDEMARGLKRKTGRSARFFFFFSFRVWKSVIRADGREREVESYYTRDYSRAAPKETTGRMGRPCAAAVR